MTAALSLEAAGIDVQVFEQAPAIEALGVGINLQPNAVRELTELGLADELKSVAIETSTLTYYNRFGQAIWSEPRGRAAGYAWPQYSIDRGDLHMILIAAARARVGERRIFTGHRLVSFEQSSRDVTANFIDSVTGRPLPSYKGDVLIGADGIHSAVRAQLYPKEGRPVSSGRIQWRGVVEAQPFLDGRTHVTIGSRNCRAVIYPISEKARQRGRSLINWITVLGQQSASGQPGTWDRRASKERFFEHFRAGTSFGFRLLTWWPRPRRFSSIPRTIAILCRAGASGALRCSAMPPIRCGPSDHKLEAKLWSIPEC